LFGAGGDVKNIEAWLMQTDGDPTFTADFQSPSPDNPTAISFTPEIAAVQSSTLSENLDYSSCQGTGIASREQATSNSVDVNIAALSDLCSEQLPSVEPKVGHVNCDSDAVTEQAPSEPLCSTAEDQSSTMLLCDSGGTGSQLESSAVSAAKMAGQAEHNPSLPVSIGDEDYVDERQLMEYLRQLELERSEELLLLEAATSVKESTTSSDQEPADSGGTGARPKVNYRILVFKGTVPRDFRPLFFLKSINTPMPLIHALKYFRIRGDIREYRYTGTVC
jgi:hypothetical protein